MSAQPMQLLWLFGFFAVMLFVIGIYSVLVTRNLIRALIGLEILIKAVTLLIIVVGYINKHEALAQSFVITLIVIETVVMTVAIGIIFGIKGHTDSLDARNIRNLKG